MAFILGMSHARSHSTRPATLPSLPAVQQDPTILTGLPLPAILELRRQIGHLAADVEAVLYQTLTADRTKTPRRRPNPIGSSLRKLPRRDLVSRSAGS